MWGTCGAFSRPFHQVMRGIESMKNENSEYIKLAIYGMVNIRDAINGIGETIHALRETKKGKDCLGYALGILCDTTFATYEECCTALELLIAVDKEPPTTPR